MCSPQVQNTYDTTHLKKQYGEIQIDHPNIITKHEIKNFISRNFSISILNLDLNLHFSSSKIGFLQPRHKLLCLVHHDVSQNHHITHHNITNREVKHFVAQSEPKLWKNRSLFWGKRKIKLRLKSSQKALDSKITIGEIFTSSLY